MTRTKRKPAPPKPADHTDAIRSGEGWADVRTELRPGERGRTALHTRRRQSRVVRWHCDGWVDEREAAAILRFELLQDACLYGSVRSACDMSVRGNGDGLAPAVTRARTDRARAANAVCEAETGMVCLMAVVEMLADEGDPDELRARLFGGSRDWQVECARGAVALVGGELARWFGA